jgi:hypothetical protein
MKMPILKPHSTVQVFARNHIYLTTLMIAAELLNACKHDLNPRFIIEDLIDHGFLDEIPERLPDYVFIETPID